MKRICPFILAFLVLVLLIYLQRKHKNRKGGLDKSDE